MIFRRRTTEQVYSTLQQVQRRMSEQGGAPAQAVGSGGTRPFTASGARVAVGNVAGPRYPTPPGGIVVPSTSANSANDQTESGPPLGGMLTQNPPGVSRFTLQLPLHLAITLMLLWLVTVILAFVLGRMSSDRAPMPISQAPASTSTPAAPVEAPERGRFVFLLKSVPTTNEQMRQQWQKEVDRLNDVCRQNVGKGWKPFFALREPENGGLQLVFGQIEGRFGIDQAKFTDFVRLLTQPKSKGGGDYTQGRWLPVEP